MRANAIIRILVWSIVILVLIGILLGALALDGFSHRVRHVEDVVAYTEVPEDLTRTELTPATEMVEPSVLAPTPSWNDDLQTTVPVQTTLRIHFSPNEHSVEKSTVEPGQTVILSRQETINDKPWAYITQPDTGWILTEHLDMEKATNAAIAAGTQVREMPQANGTSLARLTEGTLVYAEKMESMADGDWAYITYPKKGWVLAQDLLTDLASNASTTSLAVLRSEPSQSGEVLGQLESGTDVRIEKKTLSGDWAYVIRPSTGWLPVADLNISGSIPVEETVPPETVPELPPETAPASLSAAIPENALTFDASRITGIQIAWVAGDVVLEPWDGDTIAVSEDGSYSAKYPFVCREKKGELEIDFCEETTLKSFFGRKSQPVKNLLVQIPRNWAGQELEVEIAAGNLELRDQTFDEVEIDGASGICLFDNCVIQELDLDTAAGEVEFYGQLHSLDFDSASACFQGTLTNVPRQIKIDSMSADLELTLPEDAGLSVKLDGMSMDFSSDFPTTVQNGRHTCGDGRCHIDVDAMSGDVTIRKAS